MSPAVPTFPPATAAVQAETRQENASFVSIRKKFNSHISQSTHARQTRQTERRPRKNFQHDPSSHYNLAQPSLGLFSLPFAVTAANTLKPCVGTKMEPSPATSWPPSAYGANLPESPYASWVVWWSWWSWENCHNAQLEVR